MSDDRAKDFVRRFRPSAPQSLLLRMVTVIVTVNPRLGLERPVLRVLAPSPFNRRTR